MNRDLRLLYRDIPSMTCIAGCTDCCGPVPFSADEWARVRDRLPMGSEVRSEASETYAVKTGTLTCAFATATGCSVYADRPFICRLFGVARDEMLTCPNGCRASRPLTGEKAARLTSRYVSLCQSTAPHAPENREDPA